MKESGKNILQILFGRTGTRDSDLISRRAVHPANGKVMPHACARHRDLGGRPRWPDGNTFGQGTLFPPYVTSGQIKKIQRLIAAEYAKYRQGLPSRVIEARPAGDSMRIKVELDQYGIGTVGSFIRGRNQVSTVF